MATRATSKLHSQQSVDEAILAKLGYKQELRRAFRPLEVFGVAFSYIGVVSSISSVLFYAIPNGGPVAMVWGWAFSLFFIMCIGLAMAELASSAPTSGGLYYWTHSLASPRCRNFLAWIVGYANTIQNITGVASVDWACAVQIMAAVSIATNQTYATTNKELYGIFAALVLSHAVIVSLGTKALARLQTLYMSLNVCLFLIIIITLPAATPSEYRNTASFALGGFTNLNGWPSGLAFIFSLTTPLWVIGGYDCSVHMSEEAANADVAIPWAIINSIIVCGIMGWGINVALAFCMGTDVSAILNSPTSQPMAQILYNSLGKKGALAVWSLIIIVQYMMGSNCLLVGSRQTFAFSRDGALPFSRYLYRINRYTKTPVNTVWFDAILVLAIGLLAFAGSQAIDAVFTIAITASYISYITPITTRFVFKNNFKPGPFNLGRLSFPVAAIAVSWMVFMNVIFFFPTTPQTNAQEMNYTVVVLGGFMSLAIFWYYCPVYGGVHWFNGPISNLAQVVSGQQGEEDSVSEKIDKRDTVLSVSSIDV
ncbi:amino acid transporter [Rhizopogon vinicolor AM-OR11-026]|uniref:Amino acid transporter n=1 Tax=Rhizopogon vinicolor AM-OR11-026 TaxID=1314800 RepID=A0A1B7ND25_9AGAM|nr:amino acid transporter [Rhizopogon vinicolor AM-OR11-026]